MNDPNKTGAFQPYGQDSSAGDTAAAPPTHIGRYRIERILGQGGFGLVYLAHDEQLSRPVAIKVPHRKLVDRPEAAAAYLTEARTVANLDHPHIVPVYDVGSTEHCLCYVVSKYIDGSDLATRLKQSRLSIHETVELVATVAEALHFAHKQGLVHRDIKPGNILLDRTGKPFVADFGLALREQEDQLQLRHAGTPAYMSPEQARGEGHRVDGRSDIFSLGVVFYELLTGRRPFKADAQVELPEQIINREPRPLRQIDDNIPKELERVCLKALSKRASERYTTAKDMADDLRHFLAGASAEEKSTLTGRVKNEADVATPVLTPTTPPASDPQPIKIVPKGLRSFDAHDADFFLELLPGPRDREGLPDSIRFWKTRIEEMDPEKTFSAGLICGPSGCGKSSLMKAGLLPRLGGNVIAVYIEATAEETETRLLNGLRKKCSSLPTNLGLKETLAALRRGQGIPVGKKVLIVLDQFEQWLHAKKEEEDTELVQALRQCDGGRLQCLVMVRDDFWMAVIRFMRELEVRLVEGHNSAAVDLFPIRHAEKVLAAFGRAFGVLREGDLSSSPMDPALQSLLGRLEQLSDQFQELREGVQKAIQVADLDPEMALTRTRKVLEYVIRDVYERRIKEPAGTRPLENLLQRIVKDGYFPDRLDAYANTIRKLGNVGTHGFDGNITASDVYQSLTHLMLILNWYLEVERPESLGQPVKVIGTTPGKRIADNASEDEQEFVRQAVAELAQEGKVICVRLSLFAEMMKGKTWTLATLKEVGGTKGIGVTFLEETFSATTAPPEHRYHQQAARRVLRALLPEVGTDIKGMMRSKQELLEASGYASRPKDFEELLRILDSEIRLITPTDPEGKEDAEPSKAQAGVKFYQLTHDYLVPSLRDWLTRKQKETRRGRAELLLADRAAVWNARPENRQLPSLLQWTQIRWWTKKKDWTPPQRKMMRKATRYHAVRGLIVAVLLVTGSLLGLGIRSHLIEQDRIRDVAAIEENNATKAAGLVKTLLNAKITQVPGIIDEIEKYRTWADPLLKEENAKAAVGSPQKLHTSLALLPVDPGQINDLYTRLLDAEPMEVPVIVDALAPHKDALRDKLWAVVESPEKGKESQRLRAASALAKYDPESKKWATTQKAVGNDLVAVPALHLSFWMDSLRPVRTKLIPQLSAVFGDAGRKETERSLATDILADYAADNPQELAELVMIANPAQFAVIYPKLKEQGQKGQPVLVAEIAKQVQVVVAKDKLILEKKEAIAEDDAKVKGMCAKRYEVRLKAGKKYRLTMDSKDLDSFLVLQDKAGKELAFDDDGGGFPNSLLLYTPATDDTYMVFAASFTGTGSFSVKGTGTFHLRIVETFAGDGDDGKEKLAKRQANAAVALLRMKQSEKVWPLLERGKEPDDPRVRSYLIHRFGPLGADPGAIINRLDEETDVTKRRALILSLGEFDATAIGERQDLVAKLLKTYGEADDPGLHGAAEWLLRQWKQDDKLGGMDEQLKGEQEQRVKKIREYLKSRDASAPGANPVKDARWYVNSEGQTMVVVPGPVRFQIGSPPTEEERAGGPEGRNEKQVEKRIRRSFAIATKAVTVEQFKKFRQDPTYNEVYSSKPNCPINTVTWYDAVAYCNWLSEKEGLEPVYEPTKGKVYGPGMKVKANYLELNGYRLPTEAEWEWACRAGTVTSRYYGETPELLGKYAWYTAYSLNRWMLPVASLKPNDLGLFDMLGNAFQWCEDIAALYSAGEDNEDKSDVKGINNDNDRMLRGGSFDVPAADVRSSNRGNGVPTLRNADLGFRPSRTLLLVPFTALPPTPKGSKTEK